MNGLAKNENLYVVGNIDELGAWNHNQAVQLQPENSSSNSPVVFDNNDGGSGDVYSDENDSRENLVNESDE